MEYSHGKLMGDLATIALRAGPLLVAAWAGCSMLCAVRLLLQMPKRSHVLWKKHLLRFVGFSVCWCSRLLSWGFTWSCVRFCCQLMLNLTSSRTLLVGCHGSNALPGLGHEKGVRELLSKICLKQIAILGCTAIANRFECELLQK